MEFDISGNTTIREPKLVLSSRICIDCTNLLFKFDYEDMNDYKSLDIYDINDENEITVIPPFKGGDPTRVNETYSSNINKWVYEYKKKGS